MNTTFYLNVESKKQNKLTEKQNWNTLVNREQTDGYHKGGRVEDGEIVEGKKEKEWESLVSWSEQWLH